MTGRNGRRRRDLAEDQGPLNSFRSHSLLDTNFSHCSPFAMIAQFELFARCEMFIQWHFWPKIKIKCANTKCARSKWMFAGILAEDKDESIVKNFFRKPLITQKWKTSILYWNAILRENNFTKTILGRRCLINKESLAVKLPASGLVNSQHFLTRYDFRQLHIKSQSDSLPGIHLADSHSSVVAQS